MYLASAGPPVDDTVIQPTPDSPEGRVASCPRVAGLDPAAENLYGSVL